MRSLSEIQLAHDILHAVVTDEVDLAYTTETIVQIHAVHDVLSWVLEFPCGEEFEQNLASIKADILQRGYRPVLKQ